MQILPIFTISGKGQINASAGSSTHFTDALSFTRIYSRIRFDERNIPSFATIAFLISYLIFQHVKFLNLRYALFQDNYGQGFGYSTYFAFCAIVHGSCHET
jgi:pilus assembly protein TadC